MKDFASNYIVFALFLFFFLSDSIGFAEQWRTFYWDMHYCQEAIADKGLWQLVADFFTQFLANRWSAALMLAVPCTLGSLLLLMLLRPLQQRWAPRSSRLPHFIAPLTALIVAFVLLCGNGNQFKGMMCQVEDEDWDSIIGRCEGRKVNNMLELNMLNLALAETGQLQKKLMQQPCHDVNSLFVLKIESPYVAALLSDIYWSMGEISMSQMYAFEANEKLGNLSPRLLKRLVLTNIAFGHYKVAEKYLNWLDKTLFYRDWSARYRTLLSDEAVLADATLRLKRACIPAENVFPSAQSVAYDLQQIIEHNPEHRPSVEYLGALKRIYNL